MSTITKSSLSWKFQVPPCGDEGMSGERQEGWLRFLRQISPRDEVDLSGRLLMMVSSSSVFVNFLTAVRSRARRAREALGLQAAAGTVSASVPKYTSSDAA